LFRELPLHLGNMALFKVNTGCRDEEVCGLQWSWEVAVPELETSVFVIPADRVKNGETRLLVLNRMAQAVVDSMFEPTNIPLNISTGHRGAKLIVASALEHGPDNAHELSSQSTDGLVVSSALCTFLLVVRS